MRQQKTAAIPEGDPRELGFVAERLDRIGRMIDAAVDEGGLSGAVTLVARRGKLVHTHTSGKLDIERPAPLTVDSLFRMWSQTKPMTAAIVLSLFEEGVFMLDDPVSNWLPEFAELNVVSQSPSTPTEPARRAVTIFDLLTMTSGLPAVGRTPVAYWSTMMPVLEGTGLAAGDRLNDPSVDYEDIVVALAANPLHSHPGEQWNYGHDFDVLTLLLTRVSGKSLDELFQEKVLGPLGMHDSGFYCDEENLARLATEHLWDPAGNLLIRDRPDTSEKAGRSGRRLMSGNGMFGGLLSTPLDFARFAQMLANGGELDGVRILGRKTVELMRSNHIGDRCINAYGPNYGFGFGVFVRKTIESTYIPGSAGTYGWSGAAGTHFFVDPQEELVGLLFTQQLGMPSPVAVQFEKMTYEALA